MNLPKYRSHKIVEAIKIGNVILQTNNPVVLVPLDIKYDNIIVSLEYYNKHVPYIGGYYVRYPDGYESFSPAEAFESGYTLVEEN